MRQIPKRGFEIANATVRTRVPANLDRFTQEERLAHITQKDAFDKYEEETWFPRPIARRFNANTSDTARSRLYREPNYVGDAKYGIMKPA